jgi:hypothetical protein
MLPLHGFVAMRCQIFMRECRLRMIFNALDVDKSGTVSVLQAQSLICLLCRRAVCGGMPDRYLSGSGQH